MGLVSFAALVLAVMLTNATPGIAAKSLVEMEPRLWKHELKKTYCMMIERHRIFKVEQLDVYCAGKVGFFDDEMVRHRCIVVANATSVIVFQTFKKRAFEA